MAGSIEPASLVEYYRNFDESLRLGSGEGLVVEFERTQHLIRQVIAPTSRVVDIGGGEGPAWAPIPPGCTADHPLAEQARFVAVLADGIDSGAASSSHVLAFGTAD